MVDSYIRRPVLFIPHGRSLATWWIGAATCLAGAVVGAAILSALQHHEPAPAAGSAGDYVSLMSDYTGPGLPVGLVQVWLPASSASAALSREVRAVRVGARMADLELVALVRNGYARASYYDRDPIAITIVRLNSMAVSAFARELATSLEQIPGGATSAALYRYIEREGHDFATVSYAALRLGRQAALPYHPQFIALGNWLEASRVAALRGDRAFLALPECQAEAGRAVSLPGLSPAGRAALERVRQLMLTTPEADLDALERALTDALQILAN